MYDLASEIKVLIADDFRSFVYDTCVPTLKECAPKDTGALRASCHAEQIDEKTYWVGTDRYYARFVDEGRKEVFPTVKQALYWPNIKGGHPVAHAGPAEGKHFVDAAVKALGGY